MSGIMALLLLFGNAVAEAGARSFPAILRQGLAQRQLALSSALAAEELQL